MRNLPYYLAFICIMTMSQVTYANDEGVSSAALEGLNHYRELERDAYNSVDLDGLLNIFAEDIEFTSNGLPMLRGRKAMKDFFIDFWNTYSAQLIEVVDDDIVELDGNLIVWAHYTVKLIPKMGGESVIDKGRMLSIFKREDNGEYVLWREAGFDAGPSSQ